MFHHFMKRKKPFECAVCQIGFAEHSKLTKHISDVHEESKPVKCSKCEHTFHTKFNLNRHFASKYQNDIYKCDESTS